MALNAVKMRKNACVPVFDTYRDELIAERRAQAARETRAS